MTDPSSEPPRTLADAVQKFQKFLVERGYPETIRWLMHDNVLVDRQGQFWVRECGTKALEHASLRYSEGVERNLGVALHAICATERETFATVCVPADEVDSQYHLMGHGLKLSCPTSRMSASTVKNLLRWWILELRNNGRSKMLEI